MITIAAIAPVCTKIDSGTVYHCFVPTWTDGSTTSPNISFGTSASCEGRDYSQPPKTLSMKRSLTPRLGTVTSLRHRTGEIGPVS